MIDSDVSQCYRGVRDICDRETSENRQIGLLRFFSDAPTTASVVRPLRSVVSRALVHRERAPYPVSVIVPFLPPLNLFSRRRCQTRSSVHQSSPITSGHQPPSLVGFGRTYARLLGARHCSYDVLPPQPSVTLPVLGRRRSTHTSAEVCFPSHFLFR